MATGVKFLRYSTSSGSTSNIKSSELSAEEHTSLNGQDRTIFHHSKVETLGFGLLLPPDIDENIY